MISAWWLLAAWSGGALVGAISTALLIAAYERRLEASE